MTTYQIIIALFVAIPTLILVSTIWWLWEVLAKGKMGNAMIFIERRTRPLLYWGFVTFFVAVTACATWGLGSILLRSLGNSN